MAESDNPRVHDDAERPILSAQEKPALDEATFQQLLEAAHVLQEQRAQAPNRPKPHATEALAEIVETQEFLRSQACDLHTAATLITERLMKITSATGVAVAVMRETQLEYCAAAGDAASLVGARARMDSGLSSDGTLSTEFSREHADKHSMALSLLHEGKLAGLLEVRFARTDSIEESEMRSCQLMAGLMTEAIARSVDQEWKQTLAAERAAMLEALERIKPQLERLAVEPAPPPSAVGQPVEKLAVDLLPVVPDRPRSEKVTVESRAGVETATLPSRTRARADICPQCGYQFGEHELFCGRCGTERAAGSSPSSDPQGKSGSRLQSQYADESKQREADENNSEQPNAASPITSLSSPALRLSEEPRELSSELEKMLAQLSSAEEVEAPHEAEPGMVISGEVAAEQAAPIQEAQKAQSPWNSATQARRWLESFESKSPLGIWLSKHRADVYVGAAIILLLLAWGIRSPENHTRAKNPSQPNLTLFEKMMVSLGLAETPPVPVYLGNPNAPVWVDLHTALYYCADSEVYGKTQGGKFTTQRDAQIDQFEPATRKPCE